MKTRGWVWLESRILSSYPLTLHRKGRWLCPNAGEKESQDGESRLEVLQSTHSRPSAERHLLCKERSKPRQEEPWSRQVGVWTAAISCWIELKPRSTQRPVWQTHPTLSPSLFYFFPSLLHTVFSPHKRTSDQSPPNLMLRIKAKHKSSSLTNKQERETASTKCFSPSSDSCQAEPCSSDVNFSSHLQSFLPESSWPSSISQRHGSETCVWSLSVGSSI